MTPLHLAVWFSVRADTVAPVEALLQYDSNVSAKDGVRSFSCHHNITLAFCGCEFQAMVIIIVCPCVSPFFVF